MDFVRRNVIDAGHAGQQFSSVRLVPHEKHHLARLYYNIGNVTPGRAKNVGRSVGCAMVDDDLRGVYDMRATANVHRLSDCLRSDRTCAARTRGGDE